MGDNSGIEWTDASWNPLAGCTPVSEGCKNCYAASMALRLEAMGQAKYTGTAKRTASDGRAVFTGRINLDEAALQIPLRWKRPRRIFVNSMSDLFHEAVPDRFICDVFTVMQQAYWHTFQVLTKRPARMAEVLTKFHGARSFAERYPNIWCGTSVEHQRAADERIPHLLRVPAVIRFLSCEPLLGPIDLGRACPCGYYCDEEVGHVDHPFWSKVNPGIHWIITGGESGPDARPMHPDWARALRDQCRTADVAFFFKQWGEFLPRSQMIPGVHCSEGEQYNQPENSWIRVGKGRAGRLLDGQICNQFPNIPERGDVGYTDKGRLHRDHNGQV